MMDPGQHKRRPEYQSLVMPCEQKEFHMPPSISSSPSAEMSIYYYPVYFLKFFFIVYHHAIEGIIDDVLYQQTIFRRRAGSSEGTTWQEVKETVSWRIGTHLDSEGPHREDVRRVHAVEVGLHLWDARPAGRRRHEGRYRRRQQQKQHVGAGEQPEGCPIAAPPPGEDLKV